MPPVTRKRGLGGSNPEPKEPPRKRNRREPPQKSEEPDTPIPSVEDEEAASTYAPAQEAAQVTTRRRTRSTSAQAANLRSTSNAPSEPHYNLRSVTRSVSPSINLKATKPVGRKRGRRELEESHDEDENEEGQEIPRRNAKRSRRYVSEDEDEDTAVQPPPRATRGARRARAGRGGRGGGRGGQKLQPIQEASPARPQQTLQSSALESGEYTFTAILSASPNHFTPAHHTSPKYAEPARTPSKTQAGFDTKTPRSRQSLDMNENRTSILSDPPALRAEPPRPRQSLEMNGNRASIYKRALSPLKDNDPNSGYESLSDDDNIPDYKPGDPAWREKKVRIRNALKYIDTGKMTSPTVGIEKKEKEKEKEKEKQKQNPRMQSTSALRKNTLRAVAEWATTDASNKTPNAEQIISVLEQAKSQVSAAVASPQLLGDAEKHTSPASTPNKSFTPTKTFTVPDDSDSDPSDEDMSDDNDVTAQSSHASTTHDVTPQTHDVAPQTPGLIPQTHDPIPQTPTRASSHEAKKSQGWLRSTSKAISSTFKFLGLGSRDAPEATTTNLHHDLPDPPKFTFTSAQKPPRTPPPSQHGGRSSRMGYATERPQRFNKAMIPPERLIPRSERRKQKQKLPIERRGFLSDEELREVKRQQEKQRRKQRRAEEARLAEEDHNRTRIFTVPDSSDDESEPTSSKSESGGVLAEGVDSVSKHEDVFPPLQCPPEPVRDWEHDDKWGFTFRPDGKRYSCLWHNEPVRPWAIFFNPPQPSSSAKGWRTLRPEIQQWINEHRAWRQLRRDIENDDATQEDVDDFNQMIKDNEEGRRRAAEAPPPPPRPSNAALPGPSNSEKVMAKLNKYAPKTPSGLRNAERAYDSPVDVLESENTQEEICDTEVEIDPEILRVVANMNERVPSLPVPTWEEEDVVAPDWLKEAIPS